MISNRLKIIFGLSIPLFIAHGVEEIATGFWQLSGWDEFLFAHVLTNALTPYGAMFTIFQVMLWLLMSVIFVSILGEKQRYCLLALVGAVYIFEAHHLVRALLAGEYYPGLITSLAFPILAYFFWREWIKASKTSKSYHI